MYARGLKIARKLRWRPPIPACQPPWPRPALWRPCWLRCRWRRRNATKPLHPLQRRNPRRVRLPFSRPGPLSLRMTQPALLCHFPTWRHRLQARPTRAQAWPTRVPAWPTPVKPPKRRWNHQPSSPGLSALPPTAQGPRPQRRLDRRRLAQRCLRQPSGHRTNSAQCPVPRREALLLQLHLPWQLQECLREVGRCGLACWSSRCMAAGVKKTPADLPRPAQRGRSRTRRVRSWRSRIRRVQYWRARS